MVMTRVWAESDVMINLKTRDARVKEPLDPELNPCGHSVPQGYE